MKLRFRTYHLIAIVENLTPYVLLKFAILVTNYYFPSFPFRKVVEVQMREGRIYMTFLCVTEEISTEF